ncbi:MAG: Crp/Fnr family transcriptional regulator [Thermodesulfovibrionales bacterium]
MRLSIAELKVLPCLSLLTEEDLKLIGEGLEIKNIKKNDTIFSESQPVRDIFIVKNGSVKLYKTSSDGRELIIRIMQKGDYFCCAAALSGERYFVSASAIEDSVVVTLPLHLFKRRIFGNIDPLTMKFIKGLCNRIRYLSSVVEELTFMNVEQRVGNLLLSFAEECGKGDEVELSLTHQDIASMVGSVREVVSRVMSKFKKEGIILESNVKGFRVSKQRLVEMLSSIE